mmetsp:Transcript_23158/g.57132  ORF Transcript_23158/g.57132 Transcript_23158/m.57132 type:complete len:122 (-) Transcript_23158:308-673(-)
MGGVPWSPALQMKRDRKTLYSLLLDGIRGKRTSSRKICRLLRKTKLPDVWKLSELSLELKLEEVVTDYKKAIQRQAKKLRMDHVEARKSANRKAKKKNGKAWERKQRCQRMHQQEEARRRR